MSSSENPHSTTPTGKYSSSIFHSTCLLVLSDLSSASLGGSILSISDEFFAEAFHLLLTNVAATYYLASSSTHGSRFLSRSLHKASKGNSVPMALFLMVGKLGDITLTLTGKGFERADLQEILS